RRMDKPISKVWKVVAGVVVAAAAAFAVYQAILAVRESNQQKEQLSYYKAAGKQYFFSHRQFDSEGAAAVVKEAEQLQPHDPEIQCYVWGASAFVRPSSRADLQHAEVQCKFIAQQNRLDAEGYDFVGVVYGRNENYEDAEKAFEQAIAVKGGSYDLAE